MEKTGRNSKNIHVPTRTTSFYIDGWSMVRVFPNLMPSLQRDEPCLGVFFFFFPTKDVTCEEARGKGSSREGQELLLREATTVCKFMCIKRS